MMFLKIDLEDEPPSVEKIRSNIIESSIASKKALVSVIVGIFVGLIAWIIGFPEFGAILAIICLSYAAYQYEVAYETGWPVCPVDRDDLLSIVEMSEQDDVIENYRNKVSKINRCFVKGELDAMSIHFYRHREAKFEDAYRKAYEKVTNASV